MQMISFENDYTTGTHPKILQRLAESNLEPTSGYGMDPYCASARDKIRDACGRPGAEVQFLVGGTQANAVVIASMLHNYEGVVAAETGHINVHEAGAIEATGHKVLTLPGHMGKIDVGELSSFLQKLYQDDSQEHMVFPGMVYLSHPTEYGTLYSKEELEAIGEVCREYGMALFLDGARLGYGLMSLESSLSLADIARICDVFYIGGTKVGALCGEAVVFPKNNMPKHFLTMVKQHGALLAKGRLLGIQFDALFSDGLYFEVSRHAIEMAEKLKAVLKEKGCTFYLESPTNQQFILLENSQLERLNKHVKFSVWEKPDPGHTIIRLVTSWSTKVEDVERLREIL